MAGRYPWNIHDSGKTNPAIMSIESDILREIDFTAIISDFAVAKLRKVSGL